jgi:hypothetical protein
MLAALQQTRPWSGRRSCTICTGTDLSGPRLPPHILGGPAFRIAFRNWVEGAVALRAVPALVAAHPGQRAMRRKWGALGRAARFGDRPRSPVARRKRCPKHIPPNAEPSRTYRAYRRQAPTLLVGLAGVPCFRHPSRCTPVRRWQRFRHSLPARMSLWAPSCRRGPRAGFRVGWHRQRVRAKDSADACPCHPLAHSLARCDPRLSGLSKGGKTTLLATAEAATQLKAG